MIVARLTIDVSTRMPSPTPSVPSRPRRNGFWIFTVPPGVLRSVVVCGNLLSLLKHSAQVLEVAGHGLALNPNLGEALFGVGHQALRPLFGLSDQSCRAV